MTDLHPDVDLSASAIALYIGDSDEPLVVQLHHQITFGRYSNDMMTIPSVDLTSYHGRELGVSRLHAAIRREGEELVFEDMGSSNGSYVNGSRAAPKVPRRLASGNMIHLGKLAIEVYFNQAAERSLVQTGVLDTMPPETPPSEPGQEPLRPMGS